MNINKKMKYTEKFNPNGSEHWLQRGLHFYFFIDLSGLKEFNQLLLTLTFKNKWKSRRMIY